MQDIAATRTLMHMVAKLHYESDMSQVEIARKLDVSTATISRLLNKARAAGIVRIEVIGLSSPENMTADLIKRLGLKHAYVVDAPPGNVLGALARRWHLFFHRSRIRRWIGARYWLGECSERGDAGRHAPTAGDNDRRAERRDATSCAAFSDNRVCPPRGRTDGRHTVFSSCALSFFGGTA